MHIYSRYILLIYYCTNIVIMHLWYVYYIIVGSVVQQFLSPCVCYIYHSV